jgi:hypothetical protein
MLTNLFMATNTETLQYDSVFVVISSHFQPKLIFEGKTKDSNMGLYIYLNSVEGTGRDKHIGLRCKSIN